jgi:biopolymer transport protein ExbD
MAKRERKKMVEECGLPMTPMIDVVFQLLIFFLFSIKPEDVISHLDVLRPTPDMRTPPSQVQDMITIAIFSDAIMLNNRRVSIETLDSTLVKLASYSTTQTILIKCAPDSPHEKLVKVLDLCSKAGLQNLSVFSL